MGAIAAVEPPLKLPLPHEANKIAEYGSKYVTSVPRTSHVSQLFVPMEQWLNCSTGDPLLFRQVYSTAEFGSLLDLGRDRFIPLK